MVVQLLAGGLSVQAGGKGDGAWKTAARDPDEAGAASSGSLQKVVSMRTPRASTPYKTSSPLPAVTDPMPDRLGGGSATPIGPSCSLTDLPADVLSQINAARSAGGTCGGERFGTVAALAWNERLFSAAAGHSADMAQRDYVDHVTPEGVDFVQRMEAAGYGWSKAAENIAAGNSSVQAVMTAWLKSDGHCRNLLNPSFTEVAVACVRGPASSYGTYWTMKLGRR